MTNDISEFSAKKMRWVYEIKSKLDADVDKQRTYLVEVIKGAANLGNYFIEYNSRLYDENLKFFISRGFEIEYTFNPTCCPIKEYCIISW